MKHIKYIFGEEGQDGGLVMLSSFDTKEELDEDPAPYDHYGIIDEVLEREWRNKELINSDWIICLEDHPQRNFFLTYRQNLRDWPSTSNFPTIRPIL